MYRAVSGHTGYDKTDYGMLYFAAAGMERKGNVLSFPMQGLVVLDGGKWRSEERRVGKECRSRWSPYH